VKRRFEKALKTYMFVGLMLKAVILREVEFVYVNVSREFLTQIHTLQIDSVVQEHKLYFFK
jgi:hypothetical protein